MVAGVALETGCIRALLKAIEEVKKLKQAYKKVKGTNGSSGSNNKMFSISQCRKIATRHLCDDATQEKLGLTQR